MASAVNKAFNVISLLRQAPAPLTLTEIARSVKIAPSTAHSILNELLSLGVVTQDQDRRYRLGPATFYLGAAYARNVPIYRTVWRELVDLSRDVSLTGVIAVQWDDHHLILNVHNGGSAGMEVAFGGRVPLDVGAWGKAYFAFSGRPLPETLTAYTPATITDVEKYARAIEEVRERGYASDLEEFITGAGAVASAVTSDVGFEGIAALVGAVGDIERIGLDEAGRRVARVAARASYALGDDSRVRVVGDD
jgi:DNA-binding IclR family transcriptional regulator